MSQASSIKAGLSENHNRVAIPLFFAESGILQVTGENSIAYLQSWYASFKEDSKMIVDAAAAAQMPANYILNCNDSKQS